MISILDLVLTSKEHVVEDLTYESSMGLSEHRSLFSTVYQAARLSDEHKMIKKVDMIKPSDALRNITDWSPSSNDVFQY